MSDTFRFLIRDGLENDIAACLNLDGSYSTDYVWQMTFQDDLQNYTATFKTERLPRAMEVDYALSKRRLQLALPESQCFLVASGRAADEAESEILAEPETLGFLVMSYDPMHEIARVQDLVVSRIFRRRRIGTRLLRIARQWAKEQNARQFTIETQTKNYPAILFCQNSGLTFCGFNDQYFPNQDIAVFFGQALR
jgi:ribosomal protein S18 acetylase RimI-like enzyme